MGLFGSRDGSQQVREIRSESLTKVFQVKEQKVQIEYLNAQVGELDGKKIVLDEEMIVKTSEEVLKIFMANATKYHPVPTHITIGNDSSGESSNLGKSKNEPPKQKNDNEFFLGAQNPRYTLDEVYLQPHSRKQILHALTMEKHAKKLRNEWGLGSVIKDGRAVILNFFGPPGTGKSMTAEAIANYLGKQVMNVNYAQLESKYVGETPKNIKKCFDEATEKNAILIFDEADSFLGKRLTNVSQSADYGVNVTRSVMLMELERFSGVVIFTTNLISNYDEAFKRRIFGNIEFTLPDKEGRERIWKSHLPPQLPLEKGVTADRLAETFGKVSGADIKDIVLYASINCLQRDAQTITFEDFEEAHAYILARYSEGKTVSVTSEVISEEQYQQEMAEMNRR